MKYIIEITQVDSCPENWQDKKSWPSSGLYQVKGEEFALYQVYQYGVGYISYPDVFTSTPYEELGKAVSESLLLKAIAAAAHAKVLA
jgi:hypothetical protein